MDRIKGYTRSPKDESAVGGNKEKVNVVIPAEAGNQVKNKDKWDADRITVFYNGLIVIGCYLPFSKS